MRKGTYLWTVYGIDVRFYLSPGSASHVALEAEEARKELQSALPFHSVPEANIEPARDGLRMVFTFRFKKDFLLFDEVKRQNKLVCDPAKESLRDSLQFLEFMQFKPSRS